MPSINANDKTRSCRADLKLCQDLYTTVSTDIKRNGWDVKQNKYPIEVIRRIRVSHIDFLACQYEYRDCLAGREYKRANYDEFINNTPEAQFEISTPEKEGLDSNAIEKAVNAADEIEDLRSLLVVKNGKLISESYFQIKEDPRPQWVASVTKSIVSLLVGIAVDKGHIPSENLPIKPYFDEYYTEKERALKEKIKIVDLLQMRSGLSFADVDYWFTYDTKPGYTYTDYWYADNAKDYALQFDMVANPGEQYLYNTPAVNLLTTTINHSAGMTAGEFADKYLFDPLGIKKYVWLHDSEEYYRGSHVIYIRPRGLAKIGQVVLNNGVYNSKQIVSSSWLEKSFTVHEHHVWPEVFDAANVKLGYGYLWYISNINDYEVRIAYGYGGNFIIIVPKKNLVIVTTANSEVSFENAIANPSKIFNGIVKVLLEEN